MAQAASGGPGPVDETSAGGEVAPPPPDPPRFFGHAIVVALASGLFALAWFAVYSALDSLVWDNPDIARWVSIPQPYTMADARASIAESRSLWDEGSAAFAIVDAASDRLLGPSRASGLTAIRPPSVAGSPERRGDGASARVSCER
jgi:hypothetical protein